jgi:excisionase family DNA binding protein
MTAPETIAYNVERAAELIGISRAGLYKHIQAGDLKTCKLGARTVIERKELERFVKSEPPARGRKFAKK